VSSISRVPFTLKTSNYSYVRIDSHLSKELDDVVMQAAAASDADEVQN
jgi:hypothetical protein